MTQIIEETQLDFCDVMIKPKRSTLNSRSEVDVYRDYKLKWSNRTINGNGLMVANMASTGTFKMAKVMQYNKMFCCLQKHYTYEELYDFLTENNYSAKTFDDRICGNKYVFISSGIKDEDYTKVSKILNTKLCNNLCIDIANGYIPNLLSYVKKVRENYPDITIMVGNVVTGDMVQDLILSGADIVKIGIGPGSACITRKQTGVGRSQLSAIIDCADAAHGVGGLICADGGVNCAGDIVKAYGAGADFVMCGGLFAGTDEANGEVIEKLYKTGEYNFVYDAYSKDKVDIEPSKAKYQLKKFKQFYGMSSEFAQDKHWGGMKKYRTSEGIVTLKPYVGSCQCIIDEYLGGLRSAMTYISAKRLKDIPKCCTFYRVNRILNNDGKGISEF